MHLLAEQFVFWAWWSGFPKRGRRDLSNDTNVAALITCQIIYSCLHASIVYGRCIQIITQFTTTSRYVDWYSQICKKICDITPSNIPSIAHDSRGKREVHQDKWPTSSNSGRLMMQKRRLCCDACWEAMRRETLAIIGEDQGTRRSHTGYLTLRDCTLTFSFTRRPELTTVDRFVEKARTYAGKYRASYCGHHTSNSWGVPREPLASASRHRSL
jgi:hypothetical protein